MAKKEQATEQPMKSIEEWRQIESMERRISGIKNAIDGMRRNVKNYENKPQENAKVVYNSKVPAGDLWDTL